MSLSFFNLFLNIGNLDFVRLFRLEVLFHTFHNGWCLTVFEPSTSSWNCFCWSVLNVSFCSVKIGIMLVSHCQYTYALATFFLSFTIWKEEASVITSQKVASALHEVAVSSCVTSFHTAKEIFLWFCPNAQLTRFTQTKKS